MISIGPECFTDEDKLVISYEGRNYYRACGALVAGTPGQGHSTCVKRVGHPGSDHEDYYGVVISGAESARAQLGETGESTGPSESSA